jgi:hypothetical protein
MHLGVNLPRVDAFSTISPFNDVMRIHGEWRAIMPTSQSPHPDPLEFVDGWPVPKFGQRAMCRLFPACEGRHPLSTHGQFLVEWRGHGVVTLDDPYTTTGSPTSDARIGAKLLHMADTKGVPIIIQHSADYNPVRDIHVWLPGCGREWEFNQQYLNSAATFSVARFMDWQRTNEEHGEPQDMGTVCGMANALAANPWVCVHHLWDYEDVHGAARIAAEHLSAGLTPIIEYSNEVWNFAFPQADWVRDQMTATGKKYEQILAERLAWAWREWSQVFTRPFIRVVSDQIGRGLGSRLDRMCALLGGEFDAIATAAYFRPTKLDETGYNVTTSIDKIVSDCLADIRGRVASGIGAVAAVARRYGRRLHLYEGGQHLVGKGQPYQMQYLAAQNNPGMRECYEELVRVCEAAGVDTFCHYSGPFDKWGDSGSWSFAEFSDEDHTASAKWKGLGL